MKKVLNKIKKNLINIPILMFIMLTHTNAAYASNLDTSAFEPLTEFAGSWAQYSAVLITMLALLAFVYNIIRLGTASGNSSKREMAIRGLILSGAVAAFVPMTTIITYLLLTF